MNDINPADHHGSGTSPTSSPIFFIRVMFIRHAESMNNKLEGLGRKEYLKHRQVATLINNNNNNNNNDHNNDTNDNEC